MGIAVANRGLNFFVQFKGNIKTKKTQLEKKNLHKNGNNKNESFFLPICQVNSIRFHNDESHVQRVSSLFNGPILYTHFKS